MTTSQPAASPENAATAADALPKAVCDRVTRLALAALDVPMASVAVAEGAMLYVASCRGFPPELGAKRGSPFGCPLSRHVFTSGQRLSIDDVSAHPLGREHPGHAALGVGAFLGVPLRDPIGRTIGMVSVFAREPRVWTDEDRALLDDLAATVLADVELTAARTTAAAAERDRASAIGAMGESEERYRLLFEANPRPAWVYDIDTLRFLAVNEAATRAYGWSRDEFLGMTILDIRPPAEQDAVIRRVAESFGQVALTSEWRHRTRDGRLVDVHVMSRPVPFGNRRARLVLVDDITERKAAEAALRASEARYRQMFAGNGAVQLVLDARTGAINDANEAAAEFYGYSVGELRRMNIGDLNTLGHADLAARLEAAGRADRPTFNFVHRLRSGELRDVEVHTGPLSTGDGTLLYSIIHDVTERRRAAEGLRELEEQLRQAQKMEAVGQLAGGIAHDFNNLLTAIKGYAHIGILGLHALDRGGRPIDAATAAETIARVRADLDEIGAAADRAASLTAQLLAFSRRQMLQPVALDLNERTVAMEGMVRRLIGEHIDVRLDLAARPGHVRADPSQIEQVLLNLVLNARDAMPSGGRLTIGTADHAPGAVGGVPVATNGGAPLSAYVALTVTDTGVGMDEATMARVFEPFFTTKEVGKGTGLGLSTVYGIAKQSGGDVHIESELGRGTTVTVLLPAAARPDADAPTTTHATPSVARRRILSPVHGARAVEPGRRRATVLVVEDEASVRHLACAVLERDGYHVLAAADGVEALVMLARQDVDVLDALLTDVVMPGMSGPQLAVEVSRLHPEVRVVFMSGYADDALRRHGPLAPGATLIEKPFDLAALSNAVRAAVEGSGSPV
ncbi:MAG TPA: PAS domain S-box protein [Gemmatimonadaceae bacterium]|nr:PAS domain S-box protein [Gemmatimonadaceae bacterium]